LPTKQAEVAMESSFTKGPAGEPTREVALTEVASTELASAEVTAAEVTAAATAHARSAATTTPAVGKG
jgi:hypothetical protein